MNYSLAIGEPKPRIGTEGKTPDPSTTSVEHGS